MRTAALSILLLSGCATALTLDHDAVQHVAGCYRIDFGEWKVNRDSVSIPGGVRVFELRLKRVSPPRDAGSPEYFEVRQLGGPPFGDEVPTDPFTWNVVRRPAAGFNMSNFNGLYGLYFNVAQTDSGLVGPATIASDYLVRGLDGEVSGTVATAFVRATRIDCRR